MTRRPRFFFALLCSFPVAAAVCGCSTTVMPAPRVIAIVVPATPAPAMMSPPDPMTHPLWIEVAGQPGGQSQTGTSKPATPQDPSRQQGDTRRTHSAASGATPI
ncbi:hypothetical protein [Paraburkholderia sp. RAU2J]|uniref:hypothetical protein n=1 Tax=Paraburkholderia sp. RAU2J TaxID=1938810 RepID=UPI0011C349A1|nr:hypothetical protein [Paraburkholderia sp. RAU2J]